MASPKLALDYFPLAQGAVRKYVSSDALGKGAFTVEVLSTSTAGGVTTAAVRKTVHSEPPRVVEYEVIKDAAGVRSDGFTEFTLPIELGSEWVVSPRRYWIEALDAVVETPAGKFKGCVRVAYLIAEGDGGSGERYYAPGVGLVKVVENDEGEPFTHELIAYSGYQMKPLAEMVYIGEIVMQAKIAKRAAERLQATTDRVEVWGAVQSILGAAGIVSKILWPSPKPSKERGKWLRTLLNVDSHNPLSDREFRNHFEHYDERIEGWFEANGSAVYIDSGFDSLKSIWGHIPTNRHRFYDPLTKILTFRGESVDLGALLNALEEIRHKCRHLALP